MKSRFILPISFFYLLALSAVSIEAKQIPLEKLICYGEGSSVSISPDGKFYASMVPSGEVSCDITDPEEDLAVPVLVVINLETMEPKLYSGTQIIIELPVQLSLITNNYLFVALARLVLAINLTLIVILFTC